MTNILWKRWEIQSCNRTVDCHTMLSARPPPVRSSVPTERRNTRHSREGGGMRSYLYHGTSTSHFVRTRTRMTVFNMESVSERRIPEPSRRNSGSTTICTAASSSTDTATTSKPGSAGRTKPGLRVVILTPSSFSASEAVGLLTNTGPRRPSKSSFDRRPG